MRAGCWDAVAAQGLDQIIHPSGGHAFYIGLLDDGQQGFLAAPPRFQQAGEVAAFPQLGNMQLHGADPGVPGAVAVAIAVGDPLWAAFAVLSADLGGNLGVLPSTDPQCFPQKVHVSVHTTLAGLTTIVLLVQVNFRSRMTRWLALGYTDSFTPVLYYDITQAEELIAGYAGEHVLADKGYDAQEFRQHILELGMIPVIPPRSNRKAPADYDRHLYRERHLVECFINKIKHYRRIFSRFEKLDTRYLGFLHFTAALIWLR